jgi:hypothetical protein
LGVRGHNDLNALWTAWSARASVSSTKSAYFASY